MSASNFVETLVAAGIPTENSIVIRMAVYTSSVSIRVHPETSRYTYHTRSAAGAGFSASLPIHGVHELIEKSKRRPEHVVACSSIPTSKPVDGTVEGRRRGLLGMKKLEIVNRLGLVLKLLKVVRSGKDAYSEQR